MDKITAACAMEWSIDLEKGLRSNKPGQRIAAIEQISHRIRELSIESNITKAVSDMYGLVPGEDRLFSNTILLRLADAFRRGDNHMRRCILKVFLGELRHLSKKGKMYNGILAKHRVPNYVELLRRVKVVFDTGDQQAKSLALRLFGCWADLAKDSAQIRYVILLSLQSSHVSEVMAALFAAGCFCLLAEDFSCIILEVSINLICSPGISAIVKRAAIRSLSMMQCTLSIISSTYKVLVSTLYFNLKLDCLYFRMAGKRLVLSSMEDDFKAEMLLTLSKLASKSTILIAEQVDLLLSFLKHESTALLKARALKCLGILFSRYACHFPINTDVLGILHNVIEDSDLTLNFQCEALRILRQIFGVIPSSLSSISVPDLSKLVLNVEGAALSASELMLTLCQFSNASLNKLNDFGQHYCYIYLVVKHLVECIKESAPRYYDTYEIFCLCMYSHLASNRCKEKDLRLAPCNLEAHEGVTKPRYFIPSAWAVQERRALGFAKKMIRERNYWTAYRVGKYSFSKGLWFAATFVFRKLIHAVKSSSFSCWLTSLMLLAGGESEIKLLLFPKIGIELISELQAEGICEKEINVTEIDMEYLSGTRVDICYCEGKLGKICNRIWSSEETLALTGPSDGLFYFQRWFICLRAEFLEIVVGIFGFLSSHSFAMEVLNKEVGNENIHFAATTENMKTLLLGLTNKSLRLNQLAKNYDLLATSFLDIDHQSFRSICRLAFNCSMLAFCTAFAMDFSISHADKNIMPCSFRDQ
ncbi:Integrator complex subunit 7, partial [Ananas comosus]